MRSAFDGRGNAVGAGQLGGGADPFENLVVVVADGDGSGVGPREGAVGTPDAVGDLADSLHQDPSDNVRVNAAGSLGMIHSDPRTAIPALVHAYVHDDENDVRVVALMSLRQFGSEARIAIPLLEQFAKDPNVQQNAEAKRRVDGALNALRRRVEGGEASSPEKGTTRKMMRRGP